jgi:hypothetical protein
VIRAIFFATAVAASSGAGAATTFVCHSPTGYAYYPSDKVPLWASDRLRNSQFEITFDDERLADVKIKIGAVSKSLRAEGAEFVPLFSMAKHGYPAMIVVYPKDGILETYAVSRDGGRFRLLWTTTRSGKLSGQTTKVGAYSASCSRR